MNNTEYYKKQAENKAKNDISKGLKPDPQRHFAKENSAWAVAYLESYNNQK